VVWIICSHNHSPFIKFQLIKACSLVDRDFYFFFIFFYFFFYYTVGESFKFLSLKSLNFEIFKFSQWAAVVHTNVSGFCAL
jgi:hypothetical protein